MDIIQLAKDLGSVSGLILGVRQIWLWIPRIKFTITRAIHGSPGVAVQHQIYVTNTGGSLIPILSYSVQLKVNGSLPKTITAEGVRSEIEQRINDDPSKTDASKKSFPIMLVPMGTDLIRLRVAALNGDQVNRTFPMAISGGKISYRIQALIPFPFFPSGRLVKSHWIHIESPEELEAWIQSERNRL